MLKKLSLAALVAMGSMSVASATDLSQAIKGVNLKGFLRLRAYTDSDKTYTTRWRTTTALNFTVPVSNEVQFHTDFAYDWSMYNDATTNTGSALPSYGNTHMFLSFAKDGANVMLGKVPVSTPVTGSGVGEALGAGVIATYAVNKDLTLAAAGLDTLANTDQVTVGGKNTYAAAAIFGIKDLVNAQVWAFEVDGIINYDYVVRADVTALKDKGIALHVDYATADLDGAQYKQSYANVNASFKVKEVCAKVGFAATGKNGGTVTLDVDSPLSVINSTEQVYSITDTAGNRAYYAKLGYQVDPKTNVYAAYTHTDDSGVEGLVGAKYQYTKKFGVKVYYSALKGEGSTKTGNREARAEFKYTF